MFRGIVPQADALTKIRRAERVNLDWLIAGEGQPFIISEFRDDEAAAEALGARLQDGGDYRLYVLAGRGESAVVLTLPVVVEYEDETEASFTDVVVFQPAGDKTLAVAADWRDRLVVPAGPDVLEDLRRGYLGPRDLLGDDGLLSRARPASGSDVRKVAEQAAAYKAGPGEESQLLGHYRHLAPQQRGAVLEVVKGMDRSVSVRQAPPGGVVDPDGQGEKDAAPAKGAPHRVK